MASPNTATQDKATPSVNQRLVESSIKAMEGQVKDQTAARLQAGQNPNQILNELLGSITPARSDAQMMGEVQQLASAKVPIANSMTGLLPAIVNAAQGKGFNPLGPRMGNMGYDDAIAFMKLNEDAQKRPMEMQKMKMDVINGIVDYAVKSRNPDLFAAVTGTQTPETAIEVDMYGNPTQKGIQQKTEAEGKITDVQKKLNDAKTFEDKLINVVSSYDKLSSQRKTGPLFGTLSKLGAFVGVGDSDKAEFESSMESLIWAGASQIAGQSGRGVSDKDYQRVASMINFGQMSKEKTVEGKLQFLMNELNSKVAGGQMKIKSAKSLMSYVRAKNAGAVGIDASGNPIDKDGNVVKIKVAK